MIGESAANYRIRRKVEEARSLRTWPRRVYIGIGTEETQDERLKGAAIPRCEELRDQIKAASPSTKVRLQIGKGDDHSAKAWSRRLPYALEFLFGASPKEE